MTRVFSRIDGLLGGHILGFIKQRKGDSVDRYDKSHAVLENA